MDDAMQWMRSRYWIGLLLGMVLALGGCTADDPAPASPGSVVVPPADSDGDGVSNDQDNCPLVANAGQADADNDGIGDACDDSDSDGVLDGSDNCPLVSNPDQVNTDGGLPGGDVQGDACDTDDDADGVADGSDNCRLVPNASQADGNGNGIGDACENDNDGDCVANGADNCPLIANPDQANMDSDPFGDACDDSDLDLIVDGSDNCPTTFNPLQLDNDQDGTGDVCDADDDNDSVADGSDNCALVANTDQADADGDGSGNACDADDDNDLVLDGLDNCPLTANTLQADTDGNGIGDACDAPVNATCGSGFRPLLSPEGTVFQGYTFLGSVSNAGAVVDNDESNYAGLGVTVNLLNLSTAYIGVRLAAAQAPGRSIGYVVSRNGTLLDLNALSQVTVQTLAGSSVVESAVNGSLLQLQALGLLGGQDAVRIGFTPTKAFDGPFSLRG